MSDAGYLTLLSSAYWWRVVTHLGSAGILLPVFALHDIGIWSSQRPAAVKWLVGLSVAIALTLASKCLFWGWGIGVAPLDFTGISGHALLATAIFPVLFRIHAPVDSPGLQRVGFALGLMLAAGVGLSRIVLGAHSPSEVCAAWFLGLIVSFVTINALTSSANHSGLARYSPLLLLLAFNSTTARYLPTHDWEVKLALELAGHSKPFTRHQLRMQRIATDR